MNVYRLLISFSSSFIIMLSNRTYVYFYFYVNSLLNKLLHIFISLPFSVSSVDSESRGSESSEEKPGTGNGKRQRTSFTPAQIQTLQEEFRRSSNPTPEDMERIADLTGHPRKVVMVTINTITHFFQDSFSPPL